MSPEQCRGEPLDRRSDIFSLGIMLYELTLGKRLYKGQSDFEVLKKIVEGTVTPPRFIDPQYSPALETIVMRALEKDKDKRYQSARELQVDLEALVREHKLHVSPIALQGFMERVFGHKIEAWREAQSLGMSLGEHLQMLSPDGENVLETDDLEEIDAAEAEAAERWAHEREELIKSLEGHTPSMKSRPDFKITPQASLDALRLPERRRAPLVLTALGLVVLAGAAVAWRVHARSAVALPTPVVAVAAPAPALEPAPKPTPLDVGIVKVTTAPAGATLYLDGKRLEGASPVTLDQIEARREHVLLVQLDGHKDAIERFTLEASEVRPLELKLERDAPLTPPAPAHHTHGSHAAAAAHAARPAAVVPPPVEPAAAPPPVKLEGEGTLVVASSPWCNVSVDGQDRGPTPLSVKLPAGKHTLVLTNAEFKITRTLPVMILPNETLRKKLDFAQ
jgi:hypothetical protein